MKNQDKRVLHACTEKNVIELFSDIQCEHPLDSAIITKLEELEKAISDEGDEYEIFRQRSMTDNLWAKLLEKSIKCLCYYDTREPFLHSLPESNKQPKAYGIHALKKYYDKYTEFESILYGSNPYYRDHVIHVLRVWLAGVELLTKNDGAYLKIIKIQETDNTTYLTLNHAEIISMWTVIALTHDLGYPLEKAKGILRVTQDMVSTFVTNPDISADFAFHGAQNQLNDLIVRLLSSRMVKKGTRKVPSTEYRDRVEQNKNKKDQVQVSDEEKNQNENSQDQANTVEENIYVARIQHKYYKKFLKSLEGNKHGILSTLIISKLLKYFLEADYSLNEDYTFSEEERRQFYIRREILRAIASHTCDDIYQMYLGTFSFLLRICDDTQEWGRKRISELYVAPGEKYELIDIDLKFTSDRGNICSISERISVSDKESIISVINRFHSQSLVYITVFRDGQDTIKRDFSFSRELTIRGDDVEIILTLNIDKDKASVLSGNLKYTSNGSINEPYGKSFFEALPNNCKWKPVDDLGKLAKEDDPSTWRACNFDIALVYQSGYL